ncbi:MAG: hypothetical protein NXH75_15015, partial [Halobacteriovoraceae bacterium]|nr:hypothetical protein [Halobacteriovoraceae bacterium]
MKNGKYLPIFLLLVLGWNTQVKGLVPLENVLLGNYQIDANEETADPLTTLFQDYDDSIKQQTELKKPLGFSGEEMTDKDLFRNRIKLGLFRGFIEEGFNLENLCKQKPEINYATPSDKTQVMRAYLATLQYMTLDMATRHLPVYAKYFEYTEEEYENMVSTLVNNHCSQNLTTLSLRQLTLNMLKRWQSSESVSLPSIKGNPYFPEKLGRQESRRSSRSAEFAWTVELFKASCSWGNEVNNYRLLVPLLRSPVLASMVIREMAGQTLSWSDAKSSPTLENSNKTTQIACQNLICRRVSAETFANQTPRSVGSTA